MVISEESLKSAVKTLLIRANTILDKNIYSELCDFSDENKRPFLLENCRLAKENCRPLCQDTGLVLVFLKLPFDFSFGFDFKSVINETVKEVYQDEFYRKSTVKDALFDRENLKTNTPAVIYTDFEERKNIKIDILIKGGGAENMSFIEMFNPTAAEEEIIKTLSSKIKERALNACPPLFIGIGAGGTMDYAAVLSKKALFGGDENEFCQKLLLACDNEVLSAKITSTSAHIASKPVAVTINCHSNRHAGCEISLDGEIKYDFEDYDLIKVSPDFSGYKKVELAENGCVEQIRSLKKGEKILFSGTLYTMRDAAHKRISEYLAQNLPLPFEIKNSVIFYAGPAPKNEAKGEIIGPIGPTTAKRMDKFAPALYNLGCAATIGKGERSDEVKKACERNNAHYLSVYGGIACYLQKSFKTAELIAFPELGTEAVYKFEVENLPLTVEF